jgi:hypothetical protein
MSGSQRAGGFQVPHVNILQQYLLCYSSVLEQETQHACCKQAAEKKPDLPHEALPA